MSGATITTIKIVYPLTYEKIEWMRSELKKAEDDRQGIFAKIAKAIKGTLANKSGKGLERATFEVTKPYGHELVSYADWLKNPRKYPKCLIKDFHYTSILSRFKKFMKKLTSRNTPFRADFRLIDLELGIGTALVEEVELGIFGKQRVEGNRGIHIECKNQNSAGSVSDKCSLIFQNAMTTIDADETWFVMEGDEGLLAQLYLKYAAKHDDCRVPALLSREETYKNFQAITDMNDEKALIEFMKGLQQESANKHRIEVYNLHEVNERLREMYS